EGGRHAVLPSLVSGRMPRGNAEIAAGARTLRMLGLALGDHVTVTAPDGHAARLRVVGRVVLPGTGTYPGSDKTALGEGAVVTRSTLERLAPDFNSHPFLVDFRRPTDRKSVIRAVNRLVSGSDPEAMTVQGV